ncbi:Receptor-type tyrosine-protein phosphatase delta [Portunus trituberculatus]|uniref:Receptor-type tyrosine-protein phosphatase delta n=1 Tax=Portunus trituberculatus TaxID=210409 RepID=A0A5B7DZ73_PORTR|nr:Receptor-type tyrosine-protein phosphatase delta [Portunus trituberculatus]
MWCRCRDVRVDKPEDVQNFTCVSMNWESLNCSWSVPENPVKVTYSLTYVIQDYTKEPRRLRNPQSTERGFIKFRSLENTITYRVEITPMNDHGLPEDPNVKSVVIVPNKASLLDVPDYFKNKLRWEIISDPALGVKSLTGYDPSSRHIFGISVNTHNSSSGIKWSGCIATHGEQQPAIDEFNYTNVLSSEVKLKWDLECKAQAAQPIAFNISYCVLEKLAEKCAEPEKFIKVDGESTVQYTVRNLHAYRDYSFSIATISEELGLGKWSRNVRVKTKPAKPSAAPQNITVVSKGKTWIYLSWNPPPEPQQNGDIAMYDIWYKVKGLPSVPSYVKDNVLQCHCITTFSAALQALSSPSAKSVTNNIPIDISAVPIRDLNITCPVDQGYIPVKLRAVNTDEENQRLTGPQEDWKIPSPCQGYSHEDYQYTSEHRFSEQISVDDLNIQQVGFTMRNGQQHSQFSDRVSVQSEPHHGSINYLQKQSQKIGWIPSEEQNYLQFRLLNPTDPVTSNIVNSDNLELQNNYHHRKPVSLDTYEIPGREPPTSDRNYTTADGEAQTTYRESPITGREPSIISDQNEFGSSKHRAISDGSSHQISGLLLQLMKAKDVEVLLNTTNENFELKIKGKANFFNLLHNINFPVQNDNEAETELESQNIVHEIKGNDPPTNSVGLIDNEDLYQQDMSDLNESNHTHLALNHNTSFNHIDLNENSNFTTLSPPVIDNNSQNKLDLRVRVFVDSMQNQSSTSALSSKYESHNYQPEDSANNDTSFDGENGSFFTASITNEPNIPIFMNSSESNTDKLSEPSGFDFINISDVSSAQTNNTTFNASESGDMNGSRSRRDITVVPIIISRISQRNQLYLSYFMQGRHKINVNVLNGPNDLPLNNVEGHHERELTPIIESVVNQGIENRADE